MSKTTPKILAPAGDEAALNAAINAGCDEVYFGVTEMNMRATAARNFTLDNLKETVAHCHANNVKTCITINTVLYDDELDKMRDIVTGVKEADADAVIAADMATIQYAHEQEVEVHISTQLSVSNLESVKFYAQFADRIVLARELTIEQIADICKQIREQEIRGPKGELVEIEVFAHGAMCVAVSGRCAMSLYCYNESANRGRCTQMCRRQYKLTDLSSGHELEVDNNFVMSAADLCTIGLLDELVAAGVSVLKFEGRGRSAEYVKTVIECYKEALDSISDDSYTSDKIEEWNKRLKTVFNRGQSSGFYLGRKLDEWALGRNSQATKVKWQLGVIENYYSEAKIAQFTLTAGMSIEAGDEFVIIGNKTGAITGKFPKLMVGDKFVKSAKQGDVVTFKLEQQVRRGDTVYVVRDK